MIKIIQINLNVTRKVLKNTTFFLLFHYECKSYISNGIEAVLETCQFVYTPESPWGDLFNNAYKTFLGG